MVGNYGEIIKEALAINNMTQKQLAKKLHLSPQTINSLLQGRTSIRLDDFFMIAEILHLDPGKIFTTDNEDAKAIDAYLSAAIHKLHDYQRELILALLRYFHHVNKRLK